MTPETTADSSNRSISGSGRRWWLFLGLVLAMALAQQITITLDARDNPLAHSPILDARAYWDRAGEIAAGQWRDETPFMGAPLYPYLLAALRALGGSVSAAVALQIGMHLATIALIAIVARRRFGDHAGWLAAALYALLLEPAFYTGRLLTCSLQALLIAASLLVLVHAKSSSRVSIWAIAGVVLGISALANPPLLLAIPLVILAAAAHQPLSRAAARAVACGLGAVVAIAPATIHNYLVSREVILISAQAGITFAQGNSDGAIGIYNTIPGVSRDRRQQNQDVLRMAQAEFGPGAGWTDAGRLFFARGTTYLREDLARAATLVLRKFGWFVASDVYGDIYLPMVERAEGLSRSLWLAPLSLPWLAGLVACGLVMLMRRPIHFWPELILAVVPLVTVLAFFYSPRYRFPIAPLAAVAAAGFIVSMLQRNASTSAAAPSPSPSAHRFRPHWYRLAAVMIAAAAGPLLSLAVTRPPGLLHDTIASWRGPLRQKLAKIALDEKRHADAVAEAQRAVDYGPNDPLSHQILAGGLEGLGRIDEALFHYRGAAELDPQLLDARFRDGELLMRRGRLAEGLAEFEAAVRVAPQSPDAYVRRAQARAATGRLDLADADIERAIELARQQGQQSAADGYRDWWDKLKAGAARPK